MNTVSVIVPVYNGEKYIAECIDSVLAQTVKPNEIIVVDDGSTDNTARIVNKYQSVKYIFQKNKGVGHARNLGIDESSGEFIMFLDHDDFYAPNKLESCLKQFKIDPSISIIKGKVQLIFSNKDISNTFYEICPQLKNQEIISRTVLLGAAIFRRECLINIGGFNPEMSPADDVDLWVRLSQQNLNIHHMDDIFLYYRRHDTNMTNQAGFSNESAKNTLEMLHRTIQNRRN